MISLIYGLHALVILMVGLVYFLSRNAAPSMRNKQILGLSLAILIIITFLNWLDSSLGFAHQIVLTIIYLLLVVNALRGVKGKYPHNKLSRNILFDTLGLTVLAAIVRLAGYLGIGFAVYASSMFFVLAVLLIILLVAYLRLETRQPGNNIAHLPTVSVLVPARNEDHVLQQALSSLLKLDYPKLEIIVLDDCSQDRTSEIITSYARDGVRFVQGNQPNKDWTGKTYALHRLADEASGDYLVFCDVDVRLGASSVTELINYIVRNDIDMVSVMPARRDFDLLPGLFISRHDTYTLLSAMLPRSWQAASRSCYVAKRDMLIDNGFEPYKSSLIPETLLARQTDHRLLLGANFDVTTRKRISSIFDTHIRLSYPTSFKSVTLVGAKLIFYLSILYMVYQAAFGSIIAILTLLLFVAVHMATASAAGYIWSITSLAGWLFTLVAQFLIDTISMVKYEFDEVSWKQRNVCYPVLKAIPRLPRLDD